ncbi:purine-binding chemotaxis protein CheW [Sphingomonas laterariae]|uniref:Purine-binding chemotaxis protein CheW n=1 Tax=Edaphosphingomonas laterariae TaxID=861865 RepID=A0A239DBB1_9SPHN|nr:chemotaxis protein CheW [Sphingomonas laterariae]SNS29348.1 purine-binding chemotaxis protein CheW [Sphingomonas laterariae]
MSRQLITFQIGEQYLGVDIMAIREIRAWTPTTILPHAAPYVRGVVNLRGTVLPVLDLSARLGWGLAEPTARHVIIVVQIADQLQGLIVDAVNDIVSIDEAELQPAPALGNETAGAFLDGLVPVEGRMVMVLNLDRLSGEAAEPVADAA